MVTFRAEVYGPLDRGMIVYYNFAAENFLLKKLRSRLHSIDVEFYSKRKSSLFEPPFGRFRGNVRTSSISRWKAHVRLSIRHNGTFFSLALTAEICRRERFLKGGHFDCPF